LRVAGRSPRLEPDRAVQARPTLARSIGDASRLAALCGWRPQITLDRSLRDIWDAAG
jgi:nucleoside-diphosphate-sugar epimerase